MAYTKALQSILFIGTSLLFTACTSNQVPVTEGGYYYSGIYFGTNLPSNYKKGIRDGCTTAKGDYTKSHWLFNNNTDYNHGWFLGRNRCRPLLIVEDDK
ncbi:MAG: hypothetical protein P794_02655 [Epsilonproteobacteria bacterium (ex Lamellibrachia satsuma)]|nr:MAG: hypothetical protein P794_02655 [Epsilonproteobacteria bacterium (ex Lamellibrachia satsuma)]